MKQFASFRLDTSNQCLWKNETQLSIPPKPFAVLRYLVENPGRLVTHDELLEALWPETYVQPQVLRTYILDLRKILGDDACQPRFIQTFPKRGYSFVASISEWTVAAPAERPIRTGQAGQTSQASQISQAGQTGDRSSRAPFAASAQEEAPKLVGRARELALLADQTSLLTKGQRRIVFITGEAGIGKTALVDAFSLQLRSSTSVNIARGQCVKGFGGKEEYYPVTEALAQLCASPDGEKACRVLARMAPAWYSTRNADSGENSDSGLEQSSVRGARERMPGDLCGALEELAASKPLILIFEDLQWADDSTLHLLSALARRRAAANLMILSTYRPKEISSDHPLRELKQDLQLRKLCAEILPSPLSRAAVQELIGRELGQTELPDGLGAFVQQHSEGNPLFVIAIVEHLIAQQFLVRSSATDHRAGTDQFSTWVLKVPLHEMEAGVPDGLAQMVESEIGRLSPEEQQLLEAGSLMRVAFPAWAVAAALQKDPEATEEACDALTRRLYFLERAGQDELPDGSCSAFYVFAHGLYREVLYQRQIVSRRGQRHKRIAERLRTLFTGREADVAREIAAHYEAAGEWCSALESLRAAARHAQQRQAYTEALHLLDHALRTAENLGATDRTAEEIQIRGEISTVLSARSQESHPENLSDGMSTCKQPRRKELSHEPELSAKA